MKTKLKPCPFCGGKPKITTYNYMSYDSYGVSTGMVTKFRFSPSCCYMINWDKLYGSKAKAIKAWNRRSK